MVKVNNSPFEKEKHFKPVIGFIDDMDKFEQKDMIRKTALTKSIWYSCLIDYISEPIKTMCDIKR